MPLMSGGERQSDKTVYTLVFLVYRRNSNPILRSRENAFAAQILSENDRKRADAASASTP